MYEKKKEKTERATFSLCRVVEGAILNRINLIAKHEKTCYSKRRQFFKNIRARVEHTVEKVTNEKKV